MKKIRSILVSVLAMATMLTAAIGFSGCDVINGLLGNEPAKEVTLDTVKIVGELVDNNYGQKNANTYQLKLYSDGAYEFTKTTVVNGYNMNLGTTTVITFGTYTKGASTDGYTAYTLGEATRVIVNSYSDMGGFYIGIDTDTATYPVEIPAKTEGEKNMAQSTQDVVNEYGKTTTIYVSDSNNKISLTDPNA